MPHYHMEPVIQIQIFLLSSIIGELLGCTFSSNFFPAFSESDCRRLKWWEQRDLVAFLDDMLKNLEITVLVWLYSFLHTLTVYFLTWLLQPTSGVSLLGDVALELLLELDELIRRLVEWFPPLTAWQLEMPTRINVN